MEVRLIKMEVLSMLEMVTKQKVTLETIHKDVVKLQKDVAKIKESIMEETELTEYAKRELKKARATPLSKYISHEEVKRKLHLK